MAISVGSWATDMTFRVETLNDDRTIVRVWHPSGSLLIEEWQYNGVSHRANGPAFWQWSFAGELTSEEWCFNGNRHRVDGPAYLSWDHDGNLICTDWRRHGKNMTNLVDDYYNQHDFKTTTSLSKDKTIAIIRRQNQHGVLVYEERRVNGIRHSNTMPSIITWDCNGKVAETWWFENDCLVRIDSVVFDV